MKRQVVETLERRKDMMISALWSNSNYDDDKGTRARAIEEVEENYKNAVAMLKSGSQEEQEEEIDEDNPFMKPVKQAMDELDSKMPKQPKNADGTVEEAVDQYEGIDQ